MSPNLVTYSGLAVDPFDLHYSDIRLVDLAHALSNLCRFTGHCSRFYSVAQHSVIVSQLVPSRWALLHDSWEAYAGDFARPIKSRLRVEGKVMRWYEERALAVIGEALGLPRMTDSERLAIKHADMIVFATEARDLTPRPPLWADQVAGIQTLPDMIAPASPSEARDLFLYRWQQLGGLL